MQFAQRFDKYLDKNFFQHRVSELLYVIGNLGKGRVVVRMESRKVHTC